MHLGVKVMSALSCATHKKRELNTLVLTIVCCDVAGLPSNLPLPNLGEGFEQEQFTTATSPRAYLEVII